MALNLEQARFNMVEQQIRSWDVLDTRILDVLRQVPREDFVPARYRKLAFADLRLPLGHDEVMMKPLEEGRMLQALAVRPGERVLEVGTGSGFVAACLRALGASVVSVEIHPELAEAAEARWRRLGLDGIVGRTGDALAADFGADQSFDAVVVTASAARVPDRLLRQVGPAGRLFAVQGHSPAMEAVCLTRLGASRWHTDSLFETDLPRLRGAEDRPQFEF